MHAQAKDLQILPGAIDRYGVFGKAVRREDPWDTGEKVKTGLEIAHRTLRPLIVA
ncbi:hypothetical protein [Streptomyces sp. OE57]|uniref:hypothetical protein n=1 Tax=Streptomyces lacaronensis TaxID=3379885 RepID=UPI0039B741C2